MADRVLLMGRGGLLAEWPLPPDEAARQALRPELLHALRAATTSSPQPA